MPTIDSKTHVVIRHLSERQFHDQELGDKLLHSEIVFKDSLRLTFVENGIAQEMSLEEFFEATGPDVFNSTDFHLMQCSLVLYGRYSQQLPRSFSVKVAPGTLSYQLKPRK